MSDVVVTLPRTFTWGGRRPGIQSWMAEGAMPGTPDTGTLYEYSFGGRWPKISPGERVYVVYRDRLIGYAPLVCLRDYGGNRGAFVRGGGAVAVTIADSIPGFRGWRYRFWPRELEIPIDLPDAFPELRELLEKAR